MIRILSLIGPLTGSVVITMAASARTADDYFYHAADPYTAGRFDSARSRVEIGLQQYPSDPKLQALLKKIEEQQQEGEKKEREEQQQPEERQQQGQEQGRERQQPEGKQQEQRQQGEEQEREQQQPGKEQEQLGLEEAERILDALKAREVDAQKRRRVWLSEERYTENEW